jgi:hypothetical protein
MRIIASLAALLIVALNSTQPARAWGAYGHRIINGDAARALPASVPAFVRTPRAIAELAELGPEADRVKGAGRTRDADWDPAHYLDLGDDGTIGGTLKLAQLPPTREAYDTALRGGVRAFDQYSVGYLPYEIVDGYELVVKDFAIWRVDAYGEAHGPAADRAWFAADRPLRETLTLRDIGVWGHFVGDASQPLHVSVHFNGWGDYPNPGGYTQSHVIHAYFETDFVNAHASPEAVLPKMPPYAASSAPIMGRVEAYLAATNAHVPEVYRFWDAGAFAAGTPAAVDFTLDRLAAGATMLRDLIADAYAESADAKVGYPEYDVRDILDGAVAPLPGRVGAGG